MNEQTLVIPWTPRVTRDHGINPFCLLSTCQPNIHCPLQNFYHKTSVHFFKLFLPTVTCIRFVSVTKPYPGLHDTAANDSSILGQVLWGLANVTNFHWVINYERARKGLLRFGWTRVYCSMMDVG